MKKIFYMFIISIIMLGCSNNEKKEVKIIPLNSTIQPDKVYDKEIKDDKEIKKEIIEERINDNKIIAKTTTQAIIKDKEIKNNDWIKSTYFIGRNFPDKNDIYKTKDIFYISGDSFTANGIMDKTELMIKRVVNNYDIKIKGIDKLKNGSLIFWDSKRNMLISGNNTYSSSFAHENPSSITVVNDNIYLYDKATATNYMYKINKQKLTPLDAKPIKNGGSIEAIRFNESDNEIWLLSGKIIGIMDITLSKVIKTYQLDEELCGFCFDDSVVKPITIYGLSKTKNEIYKYIFMK